MDNVNEFFLLLCSAHHLKQVGEADDGIQGRADFVCHIGQEHTLQSARFVGSLRLLFQQLLCLYESCQVTNQTESTYQVAFVVEDGQTVNLIPLHFFRRVEYWAHLTEYGHGRPKV